MRKNNNIKYTAEKNSESYISRGNKALRNQQYREAITLFEKALKLYPELDSIIRFNIVFAKSRLNNVKLSPSFIKSQFFISDSNNIKKRKLPLNILVITWDIGHNPLGRSYMLAEALDRVVQNVIITGFQFERYGKTVWEPVKDGALPVVPLKGWLFPDLLKEFERIVNKFKPDIVIACKPRLPSVQLGAMFKEKYGIPMIVDIDDHELSFIKERTEITIRQLLDLDASTVANEVEPYSELWTRLSNNLIKYADARIVSNIALEREFGGTIIPHVRDESTFNPDLYNKNAQRKKYSIPETAKVVMFFGTPRCHKGVSVLAEAVGEIKDPDFIFVVVGTAPDKSVTNKLNKLSNGKLVNLPNQPFSTIPEIIVMADIICLPQDEGHETSKYQLPAKAIDAVAMGIPLLVSNTEPLMQLVNDKVAELVDIKKLPEVIIEKAGKSRTALEKLKLRERFIEKYSYEAAGEKLRSLITDVINKRNRNSCSDLKDLISFQRKVFSVPEQTSLTQGKDIVIFWKQNDTGLYGRRHDMVIKYLAERDDVRKIVVLDAPISEYDLLKKRNGHSLTQDRKIYIKTYEKLLGQLDTDKISYHAFAHKPGIYTHKEFEKGRKPIFEGYSKYLSAVFYNESIDCTKSIFWFYPKNFLSSDIIDYFKPEKVVVDVVDDHRAWPGVSDAEKYKLTNHYRELLARSDMSFANCQPVIDSMKQFSHDIKLVPNGCEESPEIVEPVDNPMYEELKKFNGKVIGFVGNLESKIDIALLEELAATFPDTLLVLVGSTHANPAIRQLVKYQNVRMFGVIQHDYISAIITKFTVGIIPHLNTKLTESMNPLKAFVYLSNNVPVVATNIPNLPSTENIITSNNSSDFIESVKSFLCNQKKLNVFENTKFIKESSWKARFCSLLDEAFSRTPDFGVNLWGAPCSESKNEFQTLIKNYNVNHYESIVNYLYHSSTEPDLNNEKVAGGIVLSYIKKCVAKNKPFSIVRFNDGEGCIFFDDAFNSEYPFLSEYVEKKISEIVFGDTAVVYDNKKDFFEILKNAALNADVVGIPELGFFRRRCTNMKPADMDVRAISGSLAQVHWFNKLEHSKNKLFVSPWISRLLLPHYNEILNLFEHVAIITGNKGLGNKIYNAFKLSNYVFEIDIPTQRSMKKESSKENSHYPERYQDVLKEIKALPKGTLVLVGAGLLGKGYANHAKSIGLSAIDIGHVADLWDGENSRPGFSSEDIKKWAI